MGLIKLSTHSLKLHVEILLVSSSGQGRQVSLCLAKLIWIIQMIVDGHLTKHWNEASGPPMYQIHCWLGKHMKEKLPQNMVNF